MDHTEANATEENKLSVIRKKKSFLRDGSYRIFHITKKPKEDSDDDDHHHRNKTNNSNNNIDRTINKKKKKSCKITNRNGLKHFLFLHKTSCDSPALEVETPPLPHDSSNEQSPSIVHDTMKNQESCATRAIRSKKDVAAGTIDETTVHNNLLARADKTSKKQVLINIQPEVRGNFRRRRKRFFVACGTVLVASSIIITIVIYTIIMTIKHKTQMNQLSTRSSH